MFTTVSKLLIYLLFVCVPLIRAQATGGTLSGTVTNPSGSPLANAAVTITNTSTNASERVRNQYAVGAGAADHRPEPPAARESAAGSDAAGGPFSADPGSGPPAGMEYQRPALLCESTRPGGCH